MYLRDFHTSVQHPVACVNEVTTNTVNATLFVSSFTGQCFFYCGMFRFSFQTSSGNIHRIFKIYQKADNKKYNVLFSNDFSTVQL
jgi:hypothetical protein